MGQVLSLPLGVVLAGVTVAAVTDLWRFKVYNLLTLPLLLAGLGYHAFVGGPSALLAGALGACFGLGVLLPFYLLGGMGGGDLKLLAAVGAWLGIPLTFCIFVASSLAAGLYGLGLVLLGARRGRERPRLLNAGDPEDRVEGQVLRHDRRGRVVPFAAMIALGLVTLLLLARNGQSP